MKNYNDTIENRTRDLPAFSVVPQPTAPSRAPFYQYMIVISKHGTYYIPIYLKQKFYIFPTECLYCFSYRSQNEMQLFVSAVT